MNAQALGTIKHITGVYKRQAFFFSAKTLLPEGEESRKVSKTSCVHEALK